MTFGEKLKKARVEAGYTQEELANLLLVSRAAIAKWESDRGMPDIMNLKSIANTLNISIDYLLDHDSSIDLSVTKKAIDFTQYSTKEKLSRLGKIEIKEKMIRDEFKDSEILRLTITKIKNSKSENTADTAIGMIALLLGKIPLFGTQEFGKMASSLDQQYYLVNDENKQYLVLISDEHMIIRALASPITAKKFEIGEIELQIAGKVA